MKENKIYLSIIAECEALQYKSVGNGHHLAQRLTKQIVIALLTDKEKSIYNELSNIPISTKSIAIKLKIKSKNISVHLSRMQDKLSFIHSEIDDKGNRQWITL